METFKEIREILAKLAISQAQTSEQMKGTDEQEKKQVWRWINYLKLLRI